MAVQTDVATVTMTAVAPHVDADATIIVDAVDVVAVVMTIVVEMMEDAVAVKMLIRLPIKLLGKPSIKPLIKL